MTGLCGVLQNVGAHYCDTSAEELRMEINHWVAFWDWRFFEFKWIRVNFLEVFGWMDIVLLLKSNLEEKLLLFLVPVVAHVADSQRVSSAHLIFYTQNIFNI